MAKTAGGSKAAKKAVYCERLTRLCESYTKVLIVLADHVGSRQMAEIRLALRGKAVVLMGKNTIIRTALKKLCTALPALDQLIPLVKQNVGLIFCIDDASNVRKIVLDNKVPAPARQGVFAPCNVVVPAGPTGLDPSQTSFFQALGIATKIVKGQIEIQADVSLITTGEKVTASQSALLQKLNIRPFSYGLAVKEIYDDGAVYDAAVLDLTNEDMKKKFVEGLVNVAAFSRAVGLPNQTSIMHSVVEGFRYAVAAVIESDFVFPELKAIKELLANPEALAALQSAAAGAAGTAAGAAGAAGGKGAEASKKDPEPEEKEEEEEEDMGFSLFD